MLRSSIATSASTASHRNVRDDRDPPLICRETRGVKSLICPTAEAECFSLQGWTGQIRLKSQVNFSSSFRGDATASSYDVQLHIRESISPLVHAARWIPGSRCARPGMTESEARGLS